MRYHSINKTVYSAKCHRIWCPKYRRRVLVVLVGGVEERLRAIVVEVAAAVAAGVGAGVGAGVIEVEVMPDHVNLLVEIPPTVALARFVGLLKGRSARLLRKEFPRLRRLPVLLPVLWSPSWFVSTVGGAPLAVVRRDVENQVENQKAASRR